MISHLNLSKIKQQILSEHFISEKRFYLSSYAVYFIRLLECVGIYIFCVVDLYSPQHEPSSSGNGPTEGLRGGSRHDQVRKGTSRNNQLL